MSQSKLVPPVLWVIHSRKLWGRSHNIQTIVNNGKIVYERIKPGTSMISWFSVPNLDCNTAEAYGSLLLHTINAYYSKFAPHIGSAPFSSSSCRWSCIGSQSTCTVMSNTALLTLRPLNVEDKVSTQGLVPFIG